MAYPAKERNGTPAATVTRKSIIYCAAGDKNTKGLGAGLLGRNLVGKDVAFVESALARQSVSELTSVLAYSQI